MTNLSPWGDDRRWPDPAAHNRDGGLEQVSRSPAFDELERAVREMTAARTRLIAAKAAAEAETRRWSEILATAESEIAAARTTQVKCGPPAMQIVSDVAGRHGLTTNQILSRDTSRRFVWPRQEAMWCLHMTGRYAVAEIGRFFDRDHTTVLHGVRAHAKRMAEAASREGGAR